MVLVPGYVSWTDDGRQRAGGTIGLALGEPNVLVDTGDATQREELLGALARHGLAPADIHYVINTHGHLDHIGNNNLFPQATFLLDTDLSRDGVYWTHDFDRGELRIQAATGASSVSVIRTAGHTDHDVSVLVPTEIGMVAIVGDLFEYEGDWVDHAWKRWSRNVAVQGRSRDHILALARHIVPGHGPMFPVSDSQVTGVT